MSYHFKPLQWNRCARSALLIAFGRNERDTWNNCTAQNCRSAGRCWKFRRLPPMLAGFWKMSGGALGSLCACDCLSISICLFAWQLPCVFPLKMGGCGSASAAEGVPSTLLLGKLGKWEVVSF